ncbi:hypothetical protein AH06_226 [Erwinia phage AH06]|nr:hypothetical protein AH06_226 [Erwinia phage AH06]
MSAIDHAINDVMWNFDPSLLRAAFMTNDVAYYHTGIRQVLNTTINEAIRTKVIDAKVRRDCDVVGGVEVIIPLRNVEYIQPDNFTTVFRVPKELTNGRVITSILSVMYGFPDALFGASGQGIGSYTGSMNLTCGGGGAITQGLQQVLSSYGPAPEIQMTNVALIGQNMVAIYETQMITNMLTLRCIVSNDTEMSNIPVRAYTRFSQLVNYAVKAYIYQRLRIPVDQGALVGGVELGAFKDTIESYADAVDNYTDFLETRWKKTAAWSDKLRKHRAIRMSVPKR